MTPKEQQERDDKERPHLNNWPWALLVGAGIVALFALLIAGILYAILHKMG